MNSNPIDQIENGEVCNPNSYQFRCVDKGLKYVGFYTPEGRHEKLKNYCKKKQVNMTDLFNSFINSLPVEV